jgi:hypothetical protein
MRGDVVDQYRCGRSSSAKKADALLRISFARRSSAFSRLSALICSDSSLVIPGRCPESIFARRTYLRSVSGDPIPSLCADRRDRIELGRVLGLGLQHHPDRALTQLLRV